MTSDGRPTSNLSKVIQLRSKELGETTKQTCVALAQNILRSIRAQTRVANESKVDIEVQIADGEFYPSWKRDKGTKGKQVSRRVLRQGLNGPEVSPTKVIWHVPKYIKGEQVHSYKVFDKVSEDKTIQYILVAVSEREAHRYAKQLHKARVKRYKALAKHAVSLAMKKVYDKQNLADEQITNVARGVAIQNVEVSVVETGFNSGTVNIHVHDNLNYAVKALKNKDASVTLALQSSLNKMIGFVKQKIKAKGGSIDNSLLVPVDELIRGGMTS